MGGVMVFILMFFFVILFGFLMDYYVFILSCVCEGYDEGWMIEEVIAYGVKVIAGVVMSVVIVMVFVFVIFGMFQILFFK